MGHMNDGKIIIDCKCGTSNIIEAIPQPKNFVYNAPYQNRLNLEKK